MNRRLLVVGGVAGLYLLGMVVATVKANSGSSLYAHDCASCHGPGGRGGTDPALVPIPADFDRVTPLMPPGGFTERDELAKIKAYLRRVDSG